MRILLRQTALSVALLFTIGSSVCANGPVDVILEWNAVALEANAIDHTGPEAPGDQLSVTQGPPASARVLAIVHAAMFDAYNSVDPRYTPYLMQISWAKGASADAAVAQAAHDALTALYPGGEDFFDDALAETLSRVPNGPAKTKGRLAGALIADVLVFLRSFDGADDMGTYTPTGEIGTHVVDPLHPDQGFISPGFGDVWPFAVPHLRLFRAAPPPSLDSAEYAFALNEVKALGRVDSTERTFDETVIGLYWSYNGSPMMGTPPRLYNQITREIAMQEGNAVHENARLFALLNIAMADAGITAWDTKYAYDYWRPIIGIRNAGAGGPGDTDGNPDTVADPTWAPLGASRSNPFPGETNFTPAFPAYTSGHATFGAAAFKTLANFYQTDDIAFTFVSDEWNGVTLDQFGMVRPLIPRSFDTLSQAAAENAASRVFNGVHWRFDGTEGMRAGNGVANFIFNNWLRPRKGAKPTAIPDSDFEAQIDAYLSGTP
jgi:hypothetical protein